MTILNEIPGASERPGDCRILISEADDGATTITIPPRGAPVMVYVAGGLLLLNLLLSLYMGAMLFFAHRSVLFMAQISPNDLPISLQRFEGWLVLGWIIVEALGFWALSAILRPILLRETLTIGPQEISLRRSGFGRPEQETIPRQNVRGFHLKRDPQGFVASVLTLQARGEEVVVAESVSEADREWLASVGNALLRRS